MPHNEKRSVGADWQREAKRVCVSIDSAFRLRFGIPVPLERLEPFPRTLQEVKEFLEKEIQCSGN